LSRWFHDFMVQSPQSDGQFPMRFAIMQVWSDS
jgi:hypothetical protein